MKIAAISDINGNLPEIEPCDVLFICGNVMPENKSDIAAEIWIRSTFNSWINNIPCNQVIMVTGDKDLYIESIRDNEGKLNEILYNPTKGKFEILFNTTCVISDDVTTYKVWGISNKDPQYNMPRLCDIVLSYEAPIFTKSRKKIVEVNLTNTIKEKVPNLCLYGGISDNHKLETYKQFGKTKFINTSILYVNII